MRPAILTTCLAVIVPLSLEAAELVPANFDVDDPKRRFENVIQFPETKRDLSVVMNCFSQIEPSGKMDETACFMRDNYDTPYVAAIQKAAKKARLNPATVDGKPVKVYLQYRVEFKAEGEERAVNLYLNPGYEENVKAYGMDHVAGQRILLGKEPWQGVCPKHAKFGVWARAFLAEDGLADNPSLEHADGVMPIANCQDAIREQVRSSRYIPAFADGMPVPSTYVEPFGN